MTAPKPRTPRGVDPAEALARLAELRAEREDPPVVSLTANIDAIFAEREYRKFFRRVMRPERVDGMSLQYAEPIGPTVDTEEDLRYLERMALRDRIIEEFVATRLRFPGDIAVGDPSDALRVHEVARERGERRCAHCGTDDSAYKYQAALKPDAPFGHLRIDPTNGMRFSLSVYDYEILCHRCHSRQDFGAARTTCNRGHAAFLTEDGRHTRCRMCEPIRALEARMRMVDDPLMRDGTRLQGLPQRLPLQRGRMALVPGDVRAMPREPA